MQKREDNNMQKIEEELQNGITLFEIVSQIFGTLPHSVQMTVTTTYYNITYLTHIILFFSLLLYCDLYTFLDDLDNFDVAAKEKHIYSSDLMQTFYDLQWYISCAITVLLSAYTFFNRQSYIAKLWKIQRINKEFRSKGLQIANFDKLKYHLHFYGACVIIRWISGYLLAIHMHEELGMECSWQTYVVIISNDVLPVLVMIQYIKFIVIIGDLMRNLNNAIKKINIQMRKEDFLPNPANDQISKSSCVKVSAQVQQLSSIVRKGKFIYFFI